MDRREFGAGLVSLGVLGVGEATGQLSGKVGSGTGQAASANSGKAPAVIKSGVWKPAAGKQGDHRVGHAYVSGMLAAGNIKLEMHETIQEPGAVHEALGTHKHSEIWCVQRGVASLYLNGLEHRMEAGDVGICCAGDEHWIKNIGDVELAYFVITVGPPE